MWRAWPAFSRAVTPQQIMNHLVSAVIITRARLNRGLKT
jgi:hypothetical protein